jgi:cell division protease FtsH
LTGELLGLLLISAGKIRNRPRFIIKRGLFPVSLFPCFPHPFLGREIAQQRHYSEITAHQVDQAVSSLLKQAEKRAQEVIKNNRKLIEILIKQLQENETLDKTQIEACLGQSIQRIYPLKTIA